MKITFEKSSEGFKRPGKIPTARYIQGKGYLSPLPRKRKAIEQWDSVSGKFIQEYPSIRDASNSVEISTSTISKALKTSKPDYQGFIWKIKGQEPKVVKKEITPKKDKPAPVRVLPKRKNAAQIEQWDAATNTLLQVWMNVKMAALRLNRDTKVLHKCIRGGKPDWQGFIWKKRTV